MTSAATKPAGNVSVSQERPREISPESEGFRNFEHYGHNEKQRRECKFGALSRTDLRNPLTAIRLSSATLMQNPDIPSNESNADV
jgi:hypothetical protein